MDLEEELQQVAVARLGRVEQDLDRLGVAGVVAVGRVGVLAAGVADPGRQDARLPPDQVLHAPEAAAREHGPLSCLWCRSSSLLDCGVHPTQRLRPSGYSQPPSWARAAPPRTYRCLTGAGDRRPVRHPAARRPRRARDQGGAAGRRRLRARLRPAGQRAELALRVGQPQQGVADAGRRRTPAARELLHRLVAGADVFVQNLAPGAAGRAGLGADALQAEQPRADRLRHLRLRRRPARTSR